MLFVKINITTKFFFYKAIKRKSEELSNVGLLSTENSERNDYSTGEDVYTAISTPLPPGASKWTGSNILL